MGDFVLFYTNTCRGRQRKNPSRVRKEQKSRPDIRMGNRANFWSRKAEGRLWPADENTGALRQFLRKI